MSEADSTLAFPTAHVYPDAAELDRQFRSLETFIEHLRLTGVRTYKGPVPGQALPLEISFVTPERPGPIRRGE